MGVTKKFKTLLRKSLGGNTLFYRGCMIGNTHPEIGERYEDILRRGGVKFIVLEDEQCCAVPIKNAGDQEAFETQARRVKEWLDEHGIVKIITPCPSCFSSFKTLYPTILQDWDFEVEHATQTLARLIRKGKIKMKKGNDEIFYHDSCHLGRGEEIYDEPREIVKSAGELQEFPDNRDLSMCCGGGSGLPANCAEIASVMGKKRAEQAKGARIVTACPMCFHQLKKSGNAGEISELFEKSRK